jgi:hypothetical protein
MFLFSETFRLALGPNQPPLQWVLVFVREVERRAREADHLPPSSPEIKNVWSYVAPPSLSLHDVCRGSFCFF